MNILVKKSVRYKPFFIKGLNKVRISIDIFIGRYYISYRGIYERRGAKRRSWFLELIKHPDHCFRVPNTYVEIKKVLTIMTDVEPLIYEYEDVMISGYLIRKLLLQTTRPEIIDELGL